MLQGLCILISGLAESWWYSAKSQLSSVMVWMQDNIFYHDKHLGTGLIMHKSNKAKLQDKQQLMEVFMQGVAKLA